jgi:hypothetical protein
MFTKQVMLTHSELALHFCSVYLIEPLPGLQIVGVGQDLVVFHAGLWFLSLCFLVCFVLDGLCHKIGVIM